MIFALTAMLPTDRGGRFSGSTIGMATPVMDMRTLGLDMPVPFPSSRAAKITSPVLRRRGPMPPTFSPAKGYVALDGGHYACFTSTDQFLGALRSYVLPLV